MSFLKETEIGGDGNKEELKDRQNQPQDREGAISRRRFLGLAALAGAGVALGGLSLRRITSAETRHAVGLATTLKNIRKEQKDFLQKPDLVYDFRLNKDASGEVIGIDIIAEGFDSKGAEAGRVFYTTSMEGESLSILKPVATFPFVPTRVLRNGTGILVCGDRKSTGLALEYAPDGISFTSIPGLPQDKGFVIKADLLSNSKALLNLARFEGGELLMTYDFNTKKAEPVLSGWASPSGLFVSSSNGRVRVISSAAAGNGQLMDGYLDATFDLATNQTISAKVMHPEKSYTRSIFATVDSAGNQENIFVTNELLELYVVNKNGNITSWETTSWLAGVPNFNPDLFLDPLYAKGRIVWPAGSVSLKNNLQKRMPVIIAKSLPGTGPEVFEHYPLVDQMTVEQTEYGFGVGRENLQFGKINGKSCLFAYINRFGFAALEINDDGTPIPGAKPLYFGGLGELPKNTKIYLPNLDRNNTGK